MPALPHPRIPDLPHLAVVVLLIASVQNALSSAATTVLLLMKAVCLNAVAFVSMKGWAARVLIVEERLP